tara:strand:- start:2775 stop:4082 length:1308 start_codon:yes stop_codon:yes gene_type:complete
VASGEQALKVSSSAARPARERFMGLEWLRFGLGVFIIWFHTLHVYKPMRFWTHYVTDLGFFATSTFFVLSGFLLSHVYLDRRQDHAMREPARSFWVKRFSNLYPIHIGSLILAVLVIQIVAWMAITPADAARTARFVAYDINRPELFAGEMRHLMGNAELLINLGLNLVMLQAWNPFYLTFNPPAWSISVLFFFYLWFPWIGPALLRLAHHGRALAITCAIYIVPALVVIAISNFDTPETGILHRNPIIRFPEFVAGILLYAIYARRRDINRHAGRAASWGLFALVVVSFALGQWFLTFGSAFYYLLHDGLLLPACLATVYLAARAPAAASDRVNTWAVKLGGAALPMFALHIPLFTLYTRLEKIARGEPMLCVTGQFRACMQAASDITLSFWAYPIFLVATIAFCIVFQERFVRGVRRVIEPPLLRWLVGDKRG